MTESLIDFMAFITAIMLLIPIFIIIGWSIYTVFGIFGYNLSIIEVIGVMVFIVYLKGIPLKRKDERR